MRHKSLLPPSLDSRLRGRRSAGDSDPARPCKRVTGAAGNGRSPRSAPNLSDDSRFLPYRHCAARRRPRRRDRGPRPAAAVADRGQHAPVPVTQTRMAVSNAPAAGAADGSPAAFQVLDRRGLRPLLRDPPGHTHTHWHCTRHTKTNLNTQARTDAGCLPASRGGSVCNPALASP